MSEKKENLEGKTVDPEEKSIEVFKYSGFDSEEEAREWMLNMAKRFKEMEDGFGDIVVTWNNWRTNFEGMFNRLWLKLFGE